MKPLKLINPDREVARQQIEIAHIHQTWREWVGISGRPWTPFDERRDRPALDADEVLSRSLYRIDPQEKVPTWRKLLRRVSSWR